MKIDEILFHISLIRKTEPAGTTDVNSHGGK